MNKFYLTSVLMAIFTLPSFADIDKSASTATCDSATIGATSGSAYMDTAWTANTINLDFYSDGEKISTGSCTYDGAIELPNDPEDKTGYTFAGWKVRAASNNNENQNNNESNNNGGSNNILSTLDVTQDGLIALSKNSSGAAAGQRYNGNGFSSLVNTPYENYLQYANYLNNDQWVAMFNEPSQIYIIGDAKCSASDSDSENADGYRTYCWCKVNSYTSDLQTMENVPSSSWTYLKDFKEETGDNIEYAQDECGTLCAFDCGGGTISNSSFRTELYGQSN